MPHFEEGGLPTTQPRSSAAMPRQKLKSGGGGAKPFVDQIDLYTHKIPTPMTDDLLRHLDAQSQRLAKSQGREAFNFDTDHGHTGQPTGN